MFDEIELFNINGNDMLFHSLKGQTDNQNIICMNFLNQSELKGEHS